MIMLDTNAASDLLRGEASVDLIVRRSRRVVLSAVTAGELAFGLARRRHRSRLAQLVQALIEATETLPWTLEVARRYGEVRADCERRGRAIGALDLMIVSHAIAEGASLVTRDRSFSNLQLQELSLVTY